MMRGVRGRCVVVAGEPEMRRDGWSRAGGPQCVECRTAVHVYVDRLTASEAMRVVKIGLCLCLRLLCIQFVDARCLNIGPLSSRQAFSATAILDSQHGQPTPRDVHSRREALCTNCACSQVSRCMSALLRGHQGSRNLAGDPIRWQSVTCNLIIGPMSTSGSAPSLSLALLIDAEVGIRPWTRDLNCMPWNRPCCCMLWCKFSHRSVELTDLWVVPPT
jgi:hypothetical protein